MRIKGGFGWDHRDLSTEHTEGTDFFGLRERKKSLEEIFNKIWPMARNYSITYESKSLNYNL